jgi:predicted MFS family arabinose efflux permease
MKQIYRLWLDSYRGIPKNIWLLAFVNFINRCGGMVIAFIALFLTQKLGFGIREAGYVMTTYSVGAVAGAYLGGKLNDRFGYSAVQFWSFFINGILLIAMQYFTTYWVIIAATLLWGLSVEAFRPANQVAIMVYSDHETRTRSFSVMRLAYNLGWSIAPALGGLLVATLGWNWLFWLDGLTCIAAAFMLLIVLKPQKPPAKVEKSAIKVETQSKPLKDAQFRFFLIITFFGAMTFMQMAWTFPIFLKEIYHWDEGSIGWILALNGILCVLIELPLIYRIEHRKSSFFWVKTGFLLYAASYSFLLLPPMQAGVVMAVLYMFAISLGEILAMPFSSSWVTKRANDQNRGQYLALYTMSWSIANVCAPFFGTQIIALWGFQVLWPVVIVGCLFAFFGAHRLSKMEG